MVIMRFLLFLLLLLWEIFANIAPVHAIKSKKVVIAHPAGCDIKGNIGRKQSKIYHMLGSQSYSRTKISKK